MKKSSWFIFTFLFLIFVSSSAWIALEHIKKESLKTIKNSLQTVTLTTHEALYIWIKNRQQQIIEIAQDEALISLTQQLLQINNDKLKTSDLADSPLSQLRVFMKKKMKIHQDIGFFIISMNKKNIASMRDNNLHETNVIFKKRPVFFKRMIKGETLFVPPINSDIPIKTKNGTYVENLPTIFIGSPIYDENQKIIALLTLRIDPSYDFTRVTQLGRIGASGETYAFDKKGMLITNSRFEQQLRQIGLVAAQETSILSIRIADPGGNMLDGYTPKVTRNQLPLTVMAKSAVAGENSANVEGYRDYRGVPVFGSWIWDSSLGFGLATEIDVEEALVPNYKTRNVLILAVFSIALVSIVGFVIWTRIERQANDALEKAFSKLEKIVEERTKELQALSYQDGLTKISNRRMFDQSLDREWHRAMRYEENLSLIMIDIDFFKAYNDNYGHVQGDACLTQVAQIIAKASKRTTDTIARYGGEEFVMLLPNSSLAQANILAEQCRQEVIAQNIAHDFTQVEHLKCVSISLGVCSMVPLVNNSPPMLVQQADQQLYLAKNNGRNRVE
ncbi:MAG: GGDEF domain-containing protein [Colwellia sp.]|nr:GGDEF domain-containing protein [Colwellia sp.]